jgi:chemotaxis methyl-accepting protein methylase
MKGRSSSKDQEAQAPQAKSPAPKHIEADAEPPAFAGGTFPIVGIGASAGGLEALEGFMRATPVDSGMAFVIVQHLDPTHRALMPELLQRATAMPVTEVKDLTRVRPGCVYVIPPNKDMSLLRGVLHLLDPAERRGLRLPIDFFLRSLAQDQQERSVGVILSGMGADGTEGLRAIKEQAGLALVQDPKSAKFDGMPRSAVEAGLADIVAPVEELPRRIIAYARHPPLTSGDVSGSAEKTQSTLDKIVILLRAQTGHDFSLYKRNTLFRRVERRMGIHQITKMPAYVRYVQENAQELDLLFKELLIGVTSFFRDPSSWEQLTSKALPALIASRPAGHTFRAWVPGCSTGEEAYTLAIAFTEAWEAVHPKTRPLLQIFGTDLDREAIGKARLGHFADSIAADLTPARLKRFFSKEERGYRVVKNVRQSLIFAPQNLIMDPPFTKLDILTCRNVLIYLALDLQKKLFPLFHYSLSSGGVLFLGNAETIGSFGNLFAPVNANLRIFRRREVDPGAHPVEFPASLGASPRSAPPAPEITKPPLSVQVLADQLILQRYVPATVLTNDKGDIVYFRGQTGKYLEPGVGKANWNVFAMAREELRFELVSAFDKALRQETPVTVAGLRVKTNGSEHFVALTIQKIAAQESLQGLVMIVFADVLAPSTGVTARRSGKVSTKSPTRDARLLAFERELQHARGDLLAARAEMQTSKEEVRSANEELQSTNEELQSTNEELTTSKEEMQSMNEELQTVNNELQAKVDSLSRNESDMTNLLNSTDIATVFLDRNLNVRRYTPQATKIIKLIPGDTGRPLTDLASDLRYPQLVSDAREVLRTLVFAEKTIATHGGRWFTVRVMPYRTGDDRIDGVVITFANITAAKVLEAKLRLRRVGLEKRSAKPSLPVSRAGKHRQAKLAKRPHKKP